jgi:hypothetical protein
VLGHLRDAEAVGGDDEAMHKRVAPVFRSSGWIDEWFD